MSDTDAEADRILAALPDDGSPRSRYDVQAESGIANDDTFMAARDRLIDAGRIVASRGRGGPLRRVVELEEPEVPERQREDALYEPMGRVISDAWARDRRYSSWLLITTARQGRRNTGGTWTRPDLVLVATRQFAHVPGNHLEIVTFEVKPPGYFDVTAVYEALAHQQKAHLSYVLVHLPGEAVEVDQSIREAAERHGIGVIAAPIPDDYSTWEEVVRPSRSAPDLELLDEFIAVQLGDAHEFIRTEFPREF